MSKSGLLQIGFVENFKTYIFDIQKLSGKIRIDYDTLNKYIDDQWNDRLKCVRCYNDHLELITSDTSNVRFIMIDSGEVTTNNEKIYCGFSSDIGDTSLASQANRWNGVKIQTEVELLKCWKIEKAEEEQIDRNTTSRSQISEYSKPELPELFKWAWMGDFNEVLKKLDAFVLQERWYYGRFIKTDNFPILDKYLKYTFHRLQYESRLSENKIKECDDYAAFNTGLVDKKYKPVFALFKRMTNKTQTWEFYDFCVEGEERTGKELVRKFNPLPERACYFKNIADMLYDTKSGGISLDHEHILIENTGRLPLSFVSENCPKGFKLKDDSTLMNYGEKKQYLKELGASIKADDKTYRYMKSRLDDAVTLALKKVDWNFKTAIPMYYPTLNQMSLLLPLALSNDDKVDVALVTEKTDSGNYLGHTILSLNWAYSNARLVTRPDSDWLVAEEIYDFVEEEEL